MDNFIISKSEVKVEAKGYGMDGKIIINAPQFHKVIHAVLFSSVEAEVLLRMVDKVEQEHNYTK